MQKERKTREEKEHIQTQSKNNTKKIQQKHNNSIDGLKAGKYARMKRNRFSEHILIGIINLLLPYHFWIIYEQSEQN